VEQQQPYLAVAVVEPLLLPVDAAQHLLLVEVVQAAEVV
jgi:hypothetical protein